MNLDQLFTELSQRGVKLWAEGDQLRIRAPKGALTLELRDALSSCKGELLALCRQRDTVAQAPGRPLTPVPRDGHLPLSYAQQRLWALAHVAPDSAVYNLPLALHLTGQLHVAALEQSLRDMVQRHEILRTTFPPRDEQTSQVISLQATLTLPLVHLSELPRTKREAEAQRLAAAEAQQPFDLPRGPLLRVKLLRLVDEEHWLLLTLHHIVCDGWSFDVLLQELSVLYTAFSTGKPSPLSDLPIQYADFASWEQQALQDEGLDSHLAYWRQQLGGSVQALQLPVDHERPQHLTDQGARQSLELSQPLTETLKALSRQEGVSLFMTLLAAFQALLYRYTGQEESIVCSTAAGRQQAETKELIGYFSLLLPMRTDLSGNPSFRDLLGRVRRVVSEAYEHQEVPFQNLAALPNLARTPLTRGMFLLRTPSQRLVLPGLTVRMLDVHSQTSDFDLSLHMQEDADKLKGMVEYKTDLFKATTITQMIGHFQTLLAGMVANPEQRISDVQLHGLALPAHGKADGQVLATPEPAGAEREDAFIAPRTPMESLIADVWQEVLGVDQVSVYDSFLDLGGYSLLSAQVILTLEKKIGLRIHPREMMFQPLEHLAALYEQGAPETTDPPPKRLMQRLFETIKGKVSL